MDISKIIQLGIDYLSDYFMELVLILKNPKIYFQPVFENRSATNLVLEDNSSIHKKKKLDPRIFGFMALSIFIGSLFIGLFQTYTYSPDSASTNLLNSTSKILVDDFEISPYGNDVPVFGTFELIILTISNWFFSSLVVYIVCLLLRVKINFWDFATVFLQLQASIYLVSNFVAFLWSMVGNSIVRIFGLSVTYEMINTTLQTPATIYYVVHLILTLLYVPIALRSLTKISLMKLLIIDLVPAIWLTLFLLPSILPSSDGQFGYATMYYYNRLGGDRGQLSSEFGAILEQNRSQVSNQNLLKAGFGLLVSTTFIVAMIKARKRLKSKYSI